MFIPFIFGISAEGAERDYVLDSKGQTPRPLVAVDNVTAWPNLTQMSDGTVIATIFNKPSHGLEAGEAECWASVDGGKTWKLRGVPAPNEPNTNRMNVAVGATVTDELVAIVSGWSDRPLAGQIRVGDRPYREGIIDPWISLSGDGGRSWEIHKTTFPRVAPDGGQIIPFGNIINVAENEMLTFVYSAKVTTSTLSEETDQVFVYRSGDQGRTWQDPVNLDPDAYINETAPLYLGGGKILAAARSHGKPAGLRIYFSGDNGKTWTLRSHPIRGRRYPGDLLQLPDGRILLSYGNREGNKGVDVRISKDQGKTWSLPRRITDFEGDGGYPSSVRREDGQIITAFYAEKRSDHDRYHMGVVIWDLENTKFQYPYDM